MPAFSNEQSRTLINLDQQYSAWLDVERVLTELPYDMRRKSVGKYDYLYEIADRSGNGRSLGRWSDELAAQFETYRETKTSAKRRREATAAVLAETARLYRALRLPLVSSDAAAILREADRRRLLGDGLLVVGTNAMPAYLIEAHGEMLDVPMETEDFDIAWTGRDADIDPAVWPMLKAVDATYSVNSERPFQARNSAAFEVELLIAPSRYATLAARDWPRPVPLPEQEWLLRGKPVDRVVVARDGSPARIVAPDPRWFALHKLWLSEQAKRDALKRPKDAAQANALLDAVYLAMPQYPFDDDFATALPDELAPLFARWWEYRPDRSGPSW